jgi:hypothetical protein
MHRLVTASLLSIATCVWAADPSRSFYAPGTDVSFNEALRLSDGSLLVVGGSADLTWAGSAPVTHLSGLGPIDSHATARVAFMAHMSHDLGTLHRIYASASDGLVDFTRIRSTEIPGQPTGSIYVSGNRSTTSYTTDGYAIIKLDGNVITNPITGAAWTRDIVAKPRQAGGYTGTSAYKSMQSWDVFPDGRVMYLTGAENDFAWAEARIVNSTGSLTTLPAWRIHWGSAGEWYGSASSYPGTISESGLVLKATRNGSAKSHTWSEYTRILPDGMGGWKQGTWPEDILMKHPNSGGRGYNGYAVGSGMTWRPSLMDIDRRTGEFAFGGNIQTTHADNIADFEPAVMYFRADGSLKWWSRMYTEMRTTAGHYMSSDGAVNWTGATGIEKPTLRALAFGSGTSTRIFAGGQSDLLRSDNSGSAWSVIATTPGQILGLSERSGQPTHVLVATSSGAYLWDGSSLSSLGFPGFTLPNVGSESSITSMAEHPSHAGALFAGSGGGGAWKRSSSGTWTQTTGFGTHGGNASYVFDVTAFGSSIWYATGDGIYVSNDGGTSASKLSGTPSGICYVLKPCPSDGTKIYAGFENGLQYRNSSGTWTAGTWATGSNSGGQIRSIAVHPTDPAKVWVGTQYSGLFASTNYGANLTQAGSSGITKLPTAPNTAIKVGRSMIYDIVINPSNPSQMHVAMLGVANNSIPDQYLDAVAFDYSQPAETGNLLVVAREHGGDHSIFWTSKNIPESVFPGGPRYSVDHTLGDSGNIHISWIGRMSNADGSMRAGSWLAEYPEGGVYGSGTYTDPLMDKWPDFNSGWKDCNSTRIGTRRPVVDRITGKIIISAEGRHTLTTSNAFQKMSHPRYPTSLTSVASSTQFTISELIGRTTVQPGAATLTFTSGTQKNKTVTITAFTPSTGQVTVGSGLTAAPLPGDAVNLSEGKGVWNDFVRVYDGMLTSMSYSSILTGAWDRSTGSGGSSVSIKAVLPRRDGATDGVMIFGSGNATGLPMPTAQVPAWGSSTGMAMSGVLASLSPIMPGMDPINAAPSIVSIFASPSDLSLP